MIRVAVVGAGLAGLVVAQRLKSVADVVVFDKSRGVGGRMATRYANEFEFDHGAQFFTVRTGGFGQFLKPLLRDGVIAAWEGQFAELDRGEIRDQRRWQRDKPHFVGKPRMNCVGKALTDGLELILETRICAIEREAGGWVLSDDANRIYDGFDWLILALPAPQTAALAKGMPNLLEICGQREMLGCYALMLGFERPLALPWQAALVRNADVSWISVNSSKPGRKEPYTLVVHSTNAWADLHMESDPDRVLGHLLEEAARVTGQKLETAAHRSVHRWRYANIAARSGPRCFVDEMARLAACGDWFMRGRVEAAFLSGDELATALLEQLQPGLTP